MELLGSEELFNDGFLYREPTSALESGLISALTMRFAEVLN